MIIPTNFGRVGFIGQGKIGSRIALRLVRAGVDLTAYDLRTENLSVCIAAGARSETNPLAIAESCEVVFLSLPGPDAVAQVVTGAFGLLSAPRQGLVIVDLSTILPRVARQLGKACEALGVGFLDAPLTGGIVGADTGTFTTMVGGRREHFEKVLPLLRLFSTTVIHVGPQGHGASVKLLHNMLGEVQVYAIAEAFAFAAKLGLDLNRVYEVLSHGMATSRILTELYARGALQRNFTPRATVDMAHKDQRLLLDMAQEAGVDLTFSPTVYSKIEELRKRGLNDSDVTSAILLFEEVMGVTVRVDPAVLGDVEMT